MLSKQQVDAWRLTQEKYGKDVGRRYGGIRANPEAYKYLVSLGGIMGERINPNTGEIETGYLPKNMGFITSIGSPTPRQSNPIDQCIGEACGILKPKTKYQLRTESISKRIQSRREAYNQKTLARRAKYGGYF